MSSILKVSNEENPHTLFSTETTTTKTTTTTTCSFMKANMMILSQQHSPTVLAWLQAQLSTYVQLNLIVFVPDLSNVDYWLGKPTLCLAHHFFPDAFKHEDLFAHLNKATKENNSKAISLFQDRLNISLDINDSDLEGFFAKIQTSIEHQMTMDATLRDLFIGLTDDDNSVINDKDARKQEEESSLHQQLEELLISMMKLYHQCIDCTKHDSLTSSSSTTRSPSPRITVESIHTTVDDLQLPTQSRLLRHQSQVPELNLDDIENQFNKLDTKFKILEQNVIDQLPLEIRNHPNISTRLSAIYATHASLQSQLHKGLRNSVGIEFSTTVAYIRNELEFIQAKMLKSTTTDNAIHDLELRSAKVSNLIDTLNQRYCDRDISQQQQFETLTEKHRCVADWVNQIRIWFVETERIRFWIEERINKLIPKQVTNALENTEFDCMQQTIDEWNNAHITLEKEVDLFDAQEMTKLRCYAKKLTSAKNEDLSPADTTATEIIFTALMALDRLAHLLKRRGYELRILTLRMAWEKSYHTTEVWVFSTMENVKQFIQEKARWRPPPFCEVDTTQIHDRNEITATLTQFEEELSVFNQNQFNSTKSSYHELNDTCRVELPTHIESRQVAIEEAFNELTLYISFARQVVEQKFAVSNILTKADQLKIKGELLRKEISAAESNPNTNITDFNEKVIQFQDDVVRLVTVTASRVQYPEAPALGEQQKNEGSNEAVRMAIAARKSTLVLFGESLDQSLNSLRRVIQLQKRAKQLDDGITRLSGWVDERLRLMQKSSIDALIAGKCGLDEEDVSQLKKEITGQTTKLLGIKKNELVKMQENIQSLFQSLFASQSNNPSVVTQIEMLKSKMENLGNQIQTLENFLGTHSTRLDILGLRISWETQHAKSIVWISNTTFEVWDFISRKAQWRIATIMDEDSNSKQWEWLIKKEWKSLKDKTQEFYASQLRLVCDTFVELKSELSVISSISNGDVSTSDSGFVTPDHLQFRQDKLIQDYDTLNNLIVYAEQVILQHSALISFTTQAHSLQDQGNALITKVQYAIKNIMTIDEDNEHKGIVYEIKNYSQKVVLLWIESGSQLPYPHCSDSTRSTRPSTNDDEISSEVATAVYKIYNELQNIANQLSGFVQKLNIAMSYRYKIEKWCQETTYTITTFKEFYTTISSYQFIINKSLIKCQGLPIGINECQGIEVEFKKQMEQYESSGYLALKNQLLSLRDACVAESCDTVDFKLTDSPCLDLEKTWSVLKNSMAQFSDHLTICISRQKWWSMWEEHYSLLYNIQNEVYKWDKKRELWLSEHDHENTTSGQNELEVLVNGYKNLTEELENYISQSFPKLLNSYQNLMSVASLINPGDNADILGTLEQDKVNSILAELKETVPQQLKDIINIQNRYKWEANVDQQIKSSEEKILETERFIEKSARWSSPNVSIDRTELENIHKSTVQHVKSIDNLLENQPSLSTESVFRRNSNLEGLKGCLEQHDEFLNEVISQHQILTRILANFEGIEQNFEELKTQFLSNTSVEYESLEQYKQCIDRAFEVSNREMVYPVRHYRDHDASAREKDIAYNKNISEMIKSRHIKLKDLYKSLEAILKSKERCLRRKAAEDAYILEVDTTSAWIDIHLKQMDEYKQKSSLESLKKVVSDINDMKAEIESYTPINLLEVAANKAISSIQQQKGDDDIKEVESSVQLIKDKQKAVVAAWEKLCDDIDIIKKNKSFELRRSEFMFLESDFKNQCEELQRSVNIVDLSEITEEMSSLWQEKIHALESQILENIKLKVDDSWRSNYDELLNDYRLLKTQIQSRIKDADHFRMKRSFFDGADNLEAIINKVKIQIADLMQQSISIRGENKEQDKLLVDKMNSSFISICYMMDSNQEVYDEQHSFYRFLQLNKVPDLENADERQQVLENKWKQLKSDITKAKGEYVDTINNWFELHNKLDEIRDVALNSVLQKLHQFDPFNNEDGVVPGFLEQDSSLLSLMCHDVSVCLNTAANLGQNGINMSYFESKHDLLLKDLQEAGALLSEKKLNAQKQIDFMLCKSAVEDICSRIKGQIECVNEERTKDFNEGDNLESIYKNSSVAYTNRKNIQQSIDGDVNILKQRIDSLENDSDEVISLKQKLENSLEDLNCSLTKTNTVNGIIKDILIHKKSAEDIDLWLKGCQETISSLDTIDEQLDESVIHSEISSLFEKLSDFKSVVEEFQKMSDNLVTKGTCISVDSEAQVLSENLVNKLVKNRTTEINNQWCQINTDLENVKKTIEKTTKGRIVARKIKSLVSLIGETRSYINDISLFDFDAETVYEDDDDKTQVEEEEKKDIELDFKEEDTSDDQDEGKVSDDNCDKFDRPTEPALSTLFRKAQLEKIQTSLKNKEAKMRPLIDDEMKDLTDCLSEHKHDLDPIFFRQYNELEESIVTLKEAFKNKHTALQKSMVIGNYLTVADNVEMLQSSLEDVINRSVPYHTAVIGTFNRTDLSAKLIELDSRFKYYDRKITQGLTDAQEKVKEVTKTTHKGGLAVKEHCEELEKKWESIKRQFKTRKVELSRSIDTSSTDSTDQQSRIRKSSLPTRKASSLLRERSELSYVKQRLSPTVSSASSSSTSSKAAPPTRLSQPRFLGPIPQQPSKSATNLKPKEHNSTSLTPKPPANSYVADPHNDLDIEIGRIVNQIPYKVQVKMVPGEVGRYWFGTLNPKLCYCRVLKSKMVMVRVGGGWSELSQFLRDHALLEGDFTPRANHKNNVNTNKKNNSTRVISEEEEPEAPQIHEGFIQTHFDNTHYSHRRTQNNLVQARPLSGSPSQSISSTQTGYKDGDRYITVDSQGKQHEVHMRKASPNLMTNSSSSSTTNNTNSSGNSTPLNEFVKKRITKRKEKKPVLKLNDENINK